MNDCYLNLLVSFRALSSSDPGANYGGKNEACQYVVGLKMGDCFGFQSVMVE